jgi:hypothetical protein
MAQLVNQFAQSKEKGMLDLHMNSNIIPCRVKSDESAALTPGQAVKLVDTAEGNPVITAVDDAADDVFGFVAYNLKKNSFEANDNVEIAALRNNVMYMEASAAIARGAKVMYVVTGEKVATATATNRILGIALDKAAADGDLIRVVIDLPGDLAS